MVDQRPIANCDREWKQNMWPSIFIGLGLIGAGIIVNFLNHIEGSGWFSKTTGGFIVIGCFGAAIISLSAGVLGLLSTRKISLKGTVLIFKGSKLLDAANERESSVDLSLIRAQDWKQVGCIPLISDTTSQDERSTESAAINPKSAYIKIWRGFPLREIVEEIIRRNLKIPLFELWRVKKLDGKRIEVVARYPVFSESGKIGGNSGCDIVIQDSQSHSAKWTVMERFCRFEIRIFERATPSESNIPEIEVNTMVVQIGQDFRLGDIILSFHSYWAI